MSFLIAFFSTLNFVECSSLVFEFVWFRFQRVRAEVIADAIAELRFNCGSSLRMRAKVNVGTPAGLGTPAAAAAAAAAVEQYGSRYRGRRGCGFELSVLTILRF